jgi:hypothetical protein
MKLLLDNLCVMDETAFRCSTRTTNLTGFKCFSVNTLESVTHHVCCAVPIIPM